MSSRVPLLLGTVFPGRFAAKSSGMMEAVRTSETSVDNNITRQYNPEDSSEHHTRRRENLKSHKIFSKTFHQTVFHTRFAQKNREFNFVSNHVHRDKDNLY
jgi:hypothetical protein